MCVKLPVLFSIIGLDTHKEFHEVAYCEEKRGATPANYGRIISFILIG